MNRFLCICVLALLGGARCAAAADSPARALNRGAQVFRDNCVLCHGEDGRGRGRAARLFTPPPADLTQGQHDDAYRERIIRQGGAALGRSSAMPAWNGLLTAQQIEDLLVFVRSVRAPAADSRRAAP